MYDLSRLIDKGTFHTELQNEKPSVVQLQQKIPKCFKIDLSDFNPKEQVNIQFTYSHENKQRQHELRRQATSIKADM